MTALGIDATLNQILACVCAVLAEEGAPACDCYTTVGDPVETIGLCCACKEGMGSLRGSLMRIYRGDRTNGADSSVAAKPCASANWVAQFNVTLARCFPTLDTKGNVPSGEKTAAAAEVFHADAAAIMRAIHCCKLPEAGYVEQVNVQQDPVGGCSYLVVTVRVPVLIRADANPRP